MYVFVHLGGGHMHVQLYDIMPACVHACGVYALVIVQVQSWC